MSAAFRQIRAADKKGRLRAGLNVSINLLCEKFHFDLIAVPCSAIAVSALASVSDGRLPPAVIAAAALK